MDLLLAKPLSLLPLLDWIGLLLFFAGWMGYAVFAKRLAPRRMSLLATTNQWRRRWMMQATFRENRIVDSAVLQSLSAQEQSVTGVDTNEELVHLLDYQRLVQGASKYLSVINAALDEVMNIIR